MDLVVNIILGVMVAATPLVFAAIGELVVEKSGVLNLGVEGMMIIGAIAGFAGTLESGSFLIGIVAAVVAGAVMALLFAFLTQTLLANQVASDIPVIGKLVFGQDLLVYLSIVLIIVVSWFFRKTRGGLIVRALGENHDAAHAIGYPVVLYRYLALAFGGACAGLGGAYLSIVQTPLWVENMTAGRGWIALALVVFAAWRPWRLLLGAYLFGGITILQLYSQGFGVKIEPQYLSMLPYLATIAVLVIISSDRAKVKLNAPACLAKPFRAAS